MFRLLLLLQSLHRNIIAFIYCLCNFDGKRTEADRLHVGRRHGGPQTTDHDQKEEFVDAFSVVVDVEASGFTSDELRRILELNGAATKRLSANGVLAQSTGGTLFFGVFWCFPSTCAGGGISTHKNTIFLISGVFGVFLVFMM